MSIHSLRLPRPSCGVDKRVLDERQKRGRGKNGKSSQNHGALYAGDSGVLDFWVGRVMGEIVSAAQLINRRAGSIYLRLRQSCWEMGTVKWESTACFSSPRFPRQVISTPLTHYLKATCEEKLINIKQVESCPPLPSAFYHNRWGHFNVFCPNLKGTQRGSNPGWFLFLQRYSVMKYLFLF